MNIGSLYQVKKHFWMLFPTKETADQAAALHHAHLFGDDGNAARCAAWYSKDYKCNLSWFSPESFVVCLEEDGKFKKVLTSEGLIGWICFVESYKKCFEEVKENNPLTSPDSHGRVEA
jgi:hypothetical protein